MADIDWKGMSAAEIWAALEIAPHMAGPWSPHPSEKKAFRRLSLRTERTSLSFAKIGMAPASPSSTVNTHPPRT